MALLVGAIVLTLSVWFAGTAAVPALLLRFSAGAAMAGVYPVGMKLAGSWAVQRQQRWRPLIVSTRSMGIETSACLGSQAWAVTVVPCAWPNWGLVYQAISSRARERSFRFVNQP
jgi:MFS family permease